MSVAVRVAGLRYSCSTSMISLHEPALGTASKVQPTSELRLRTGLRDGAWPSSWDVHCRSHARSSSEAAGGCGILSSDVMSDRDFSARLGLTDHGRPSVSQHRAGGHAPTVHIRRIILPSLPLRLRLAVICRKSSSPFGEDCTQCRLPHRRTWPTSPCISAKMTLDLLFVSLCRYSCYSSLSRSCG
jgi:hypothetical protein